MIHYKTPEEIKIMQDGGLRLRKVMKELMPIVQIGISTKEIDNEAERLIQKNGGESSFKRVKGYHWSTCVPINEQVVHTPPSNRLLKNGDVLTIDIGMFYRGYHTDYADTVIIGINTDKKIVKFLDIGKKTLYKAIGQAKKGNRLGYISQTIEKEIYGSGYKILKQLTGHGVGHDLHEDPYVFGFLDQPIEKTLSLKSGLVIAIEIIYSMSSEEFTYEKGDDWSVITKDKSISACFEHTIAITDKETIVLT